MKTKQSIVGKISLGVGLVVVIAVAAWLSGSGGRGATHEGRSRHDADASHHDSSAG